MHPDTRRALRSAVLFWFLVGVGTLLATNYTLMYSPDDLAFRSVLTRPGYAFPVFGGDGRSGDVVLSATGSLTVTAGGLQYDDLTIDSGVTITLDGDTTAGTKPGNMFLIGVRGTLTINGTLTASAKGMSGGTAGTGGTALTNGQEGQPYTEYISSMNWTNYNALQAGGGGGGGGSTGTIKGGIYKGPSRLPYSDTYTTRSRYVASNITPTFMAGGYTGAASGVTGQTAPFTSCAPVGRLWYLSPFTVGVGAGGMGGAGGGPGYYAITYSATGGTGGAGGRGGGCIIIEAGSIAGTGTITADGAAGGAGETGTNGTTADGGGGGGGGGGNGGNIIVLYRGANTQTWTVSCTGGSGGAAGVGTDNAADGGAGANGNPGTSVIQKVW